MRDVKRSGCAGTIPKVLAQVPRVREVRIEISGARAQVEGEALSRAELCRTFSAPGYPEVD